MKISPVSTSHLVPLEFPNLVISCGKKTKWTGCAFALELEECWKGHEVGPAPLEAFWSVQKQLFFPRISPHKKSTYNHPKKKPGLIRHCDKMKKPTEKKQHRDFGEGLTWPTMGALLAPFLMGLGYSQGFVLFRSHLNTSDFYKLEIPCENK